ncbi:hypothetical protein PM10SUCC1_37600 [Propionigenium maris DSM 9537]|uniref:Uncharacterized protein n=1 Tax=Propionigenium maris DSM 9537 TaxID=1123000 RepID=A0A9W6LPC7_9FUSO|nr:hypothetical protein [Propionigenium maris]GLI58246.1 hypothetical protein PM10SUCC1_37600 [Propionigenium maris DSM 9537]
MNKLQGIDKSSDTLNKVFCALKEVGFEKLIILSNRGSHTYSKCRILSIGEKIVIESERGEVLIYLKDIRYARLSYRNAVCLFEASERGDREYRAENWFLMNGDQYREFSIRIG